jgi:hypothetical protein
MFKVGKWYGRADNSSKAKCMKILEKTQAYPYVFAYTGGENSGTFVVNEKGVNPLDKAMVIPKVDGRKGNKAGMAKVYSMLANLAEQIKVTNERIDLVRDHIEALQETFITKDSDSIEYGARLGIAAAKRQAELEGHQ